MSEPAKPTIGRIVHYVAATTAGTPCHRPAIVMGTSDDEARAWLTVFFSSGDRMLESTLPRPQSGWQELFAPYCAAEANRVGTWHWPEREEPRPGPPTPRSE